MFDNKELVADYMCIRKFLQSCPDIFCDSMSTLSMNCDDTSTDSYTYTNQENLKSQCLISYGALAETKSILSFLHLHL